jgi:hypothetical protein
VNEALRSALLRAGLSHVDVAGRLAVDPKTVERWMAGRIPHLRHRKAIARLVELPEHELWPTTALPPRRRQYGGEVVAAYPHRSAVPREAWQRFFKNAEHEIDILAYSGLFLVEDVGIVRLLAEKAASGVRLRLLLGDPDSAEVAQRGADEGVGELMAARIRNALALLRPLAAVQGVELRLHCTTLYNSIYRADDELLVNPHIYGMPAPSAPVLRLRRSDEAAMVSTYIDSFEGIWLSACAM